MSRSLQVRLIGWLLSALAACLVVVGALIGWIAPHLTPSAFPALHATVADSGVDSSSFLGAALTTLGVIVAILIGYNVAGMQTAGQVLSLALTRALLFSLAPFLLLWTVTTGVGLVYLLAPPVYLGQLWQLVLWFGAVVLLMLAYLFTLPWRLSGEYAARWAVNDLRAIPIADWEERDGYVVLQSGIAAASNRGDLGTVRAMSYVAGDFLVGMRDHAAEQENGYHRGRFRALKNLLTGCSQYAGSASTAVAYQLGAVTGGVLLLAAAAGHPLNQPDSDLYSGLLRSVGPSLDRIDALWTGVRHALCRGRAHQQPYLLRYWLAHESWATDDARRTQHLADGLIYLHSHCLRAVLSVSALDAPRQEVVEFEGARLLTELYRYLGTYLREDIERTTQGDRQRHMLRLAEQLLEQLHTLALQTYIAWDAESRTSLTIAYEEYRSHLPAIAVTSSASHQSGAR
ncbi:MAG: hypothetical protein ABI068_06985 [Ktedonobacterales bacterium]